MNIKIRKATVEDAQILVDFRIKQMIAIGAKEEKDIRVNLSKYYMTHIGDESQVSYLAFDADIPVATAGIIFYETPPSFSIPSGLVSELNGLYTKNNYKRQGIATKLLDKITEEAAIRSCKVIKVTASTEGEYFYKSYGFKHINYYFEYSI